MYRVFMLVESQRYYWNGNFWSEWAHSAKVLEPDEALELALSFDADFELLTQR